MRTREAIEVNQDDFRERRSRLSEPVRPTRRFPCPCRFIVPRPIRVRYAPAFPSPPHAYGSVPPGPARPASRQPTDSDMRPGPGRGAPPPALQTRHVRLHVRRPGGAGPVQGVPDSDGRTAPGERFSESGRAHPSRATDIRVFHDAFRAGLMPVCGKKTRISAA